MKNDKITPAQLAHSGKAGEKFLSNNGVTVEVVSVKVDDKVNELRYKRSFPKDCAPIGKVHFLELFKHKTFEKQTAAADSKETKAS